MESLIANTAEVARALRSGPDLLEQIGCNAYQSLQVTQVAISRSQILHWAESFFDSYTREGNSTLYISVSGEV